ncbi:MAG: hypothetical protein HC933_02740 [Pleurocapsa sp. SU_196_0]|nr:hypothetical protein [Pleurocapsa sp. SU_196_0]
MAAPQSVTLDQVLDLAELLPPEQRMTLAEILRKRDLDIRRNALIESIQEARDLFARGELKRMTVDELMEELNS